MSIYHQEAIFIILQFLQNRGLTKSFQIIQDESGIQHDPSFLLKENHLFDLLLESKKDQDVNALNNKEKALLSRMKGENGVTLIYRSSKDKRPCFKGIDFVTWIVSNGVLDNRETAIMLAENLRKRGIIEHIYSHHQPFQDKEIYYRFTEKKKTLRKAKHNRSTSYTDDSRRRNMMTPCKQINARRRALSGNAVEEFKKKNHKHAKTVKFPPRLNKRKKRVSHRKSRSEPLDENEFKGKFLFKKSNTINFSRDHHLTMPTKFKALMISPRVSVESDLDIIIDIDSPAYHILSQNHSRHKSVTIDDLVTLANSMQGSIDIKDRYCTSRLKLYRHCFIASDLVKWMVSMGAKERRAVEIGKNMQYHFIIEHVSKKFSKTFANNDEYYKVCAKFNSVEFLESTRSSEEFLDHLELPMLLLARNLEKGPALKTIRDHKEVFKRCFLGDEAVNWMIKSPNCPVQGVQEAIGLGNRLMLENLIIHASSIHPKPFQNKSETYQFTENYHKLIEANPIYQDDDKLKWSRKGYPINAEDYVLHKKLGDGNFASVFEAHCMTKDHKFKTVAIKCLDMSRIDVNLDDLYAEVTLMDKWDHPNIIKSLASFTTNIGPSKVLQKVELENKSRPDCSGPLRRINSAPAIKKRVSSRAVRTGLRRSTSTDVIMSSKRNGMHNKFMTSAPPIVEKDVENIQESISPMFSERKEKLVIANPHSDFRDNQAKDNQAKDNQEKDNQGKDNQAKDTQAKDTQAKDTQAKDTQAKDTQAKDNQAKNNQTKDDQETDDSFSFEKKQPEESSWLWIVMPLLSESWDQLLKNICPSGITDEVLLATLLKKMLLGLAYLHKDGSIHRDLKPSNVLIGHDGEVKLADFGVSANIKQRDNLGGKRKKGKKGKRMRHTRMTTEVGTFQYMAPEVHNAKKQGGYSMSVDIWSFGVSSIELAQGVVPFNFSAASGNYGIESNSKEFNEMVKRCLTINPEERPTAKALLKMPFFEKAKGKSYLKFPDIIHKLQPVTPTFKKMNTNKRHSFLGSIMH